MQRTTAIIFCSLAIFAVLACEPASEGRLGTVILSDIHPECSTVSIRFSRRGEYHGNVALWKRVENGKVRVRLGPEFVPHTYGVDAIHIECRNADNHVVSMMDNTESILIIAGENRLDRGKFAQR